jgi:hypothetical protein
LSQVEIVGWTNGVWRPGYTRSLKVGISDKVIICQVYFYVVTNDMSIIGSD